MSEVEAVPVDLETIINDYVDKNKPKVCIMTPCYGGVCFVNYVYCIMINYQ